MKLRTGLVALLLSLWQAAPGAAPQVSQAWIRVLPGNLPLAGYLTVNNPDAQAVTLVAARSTAFHAIEMHRSSAQSGVARMQPVGRLVIAPGGQVALAPGGYHLMLFGRRHTLRVGASVTVTLQFADGYQLEVPFALRAATAR